jgi:hypothetical protein
MADPNGGRFNIDVGLLSGLLLRLGVIGILGLLSAVYLRRGIFILRKLGVLDFFFAGVEDCIIPSEDESSPIVWTSRSMFVTDWRGGAAEAADITAC